MGETLQVGPLVFYQFSSGAVSLPTITEEVVFLMLYLLFSN